MTRGHSVSKLFNNHQAISKMASIACNALVSPRRSPFANIQADVLVEILHMALESERYYDASYSKAVWGYKEHMVAATHVCRHWRSVALAIPSLWSYIVIPAFSGEQVQEYLRRSRGLPLTVYIINWKGHKSGRMWHSTLPLLKEHLSRTRDWRTYSNYLADQRLSTALQDSINIEDLAIENKEIRPIPANGEPILHNFPETLVNCHFPKLRKLSLALLRPPPTLSWFHNLTHLSLHCVEISPHALLEVLEKSKELQSLRLSKLVMFQPGFYEYIDLRNIVLDHLSDLRLNLEHPENYTRILDFLALPRLNELYVSSILRDPDLIHNGVLVPTALPERMKYGSIRLSVLEKQVLIETPGRSGDAPGCSFIHFQWKIRSYHFFSHPALIINLFVELFDIHRVVFSELKELEVIFSTSEIPTFDEYAWSMMLANMHHLEKISFQIQGRTKSHAHMHHNVLRALERLSTNFYDEQKKCFCLNLRSVTLDGFMFGRLQSSQLSPMNNILEAFAKRKRDKYPLKDLKLSNTDSLNFSIISKLQSVVDKVYLDGTELQLIAPDSVQPDTGGVVYVFDEDGNLSV